MATWALLSASSTESTAASANCAPSVTTSSMVGSWRSFVAIESATASMSVPST